MGKNLKVLVDNANSELEKLVNFLENNKGLYEDRRMNFTDIMANKKALMSEFNLTDKELSKLSPRLLITFFLKRFCN